MVQHFLHYSTPHAHVTSHGQNPGIEFWASVLELIALSFAFYLAVVENRKSFLASDVLLLFWLLSFAITGVRFRTLTSDCPGGVSLLARPSSSLIEQGFVGGRLALFLVVFVLECLRRDTRIQLDEDGHVSPLTL